MLEFAQIAIGGLVVGSIYAAIALGFSLIYRVTGAINLSQGGFALVAAMIGYTFGVAWGWPLVVAIPAAVIATVIIGVSLAAFTFVPALTRLSNANVLMLTAGILTMIEGFSLVVWGSQPYAMPPFSGEQPLAFGAILIPTQAFWVFGATALSIVALWFLIIDAIQGRPLYTPTVLGTALFGRGAGLPAPDAAPDLGMVLMFTWVHGLAFVVVGGIVARLLAVAERQPSVGFGIVMLFVLFEFGFIAGAMLFRTRDA